MLKSFLLFSAIILGILNPWASKFSYLIPYLLICMLFFPFLKWKITFSIFKEKRVYLVLLLNVVVGLFGYFLFRSFNPNLALIAFLVGITPTATACPAIMGYLKGRVDFAIAAVVVTNFFMALFIPLMIYLISDLHVETSVIFIQTFGVIFIPLFLGQAIHYLFAQTRNFLSTFKNTGFYLWLFVCFVAVAKASSFVQASKMSLKEILLVGFIAGVICILNFSFGKILRLKNLSLEISQTLGQKNTIFTIWIALTYFNSYIALGPIFYLICHNLYNAYQLAIQDKKIKL